MMQTDLKISSDAVNRINELLVTKDNPDLMLRVYIQGGGCSGFQYGFQFDENQQDDDIFVEQDGIKVLVDMLSLQYLGGAEIDYKDDILGSRFLVNNPNASATCGCGSSFSI
jgi:iron-sulfur cluster insertion protein